MVTTLQLPQDPAARREDQIARLATAAALETHAGYQPGPAWDLAAKLPDDVRDGICRAARCGISSAAAAEIRRILAHASTANRVGRATTRA